MAQRDGGPRPRQRGLPGGSPPAGELAELPRTLGFQALSRGERITDQARTRPRRSRARRATSAAQPAPAEPPLERRRPQRAPPRECRPPAPEPLRAAEPEPTPDRPAPSRRSPRLTSRTHEDPPAWIEPVGAVAAEQPCRSPARADPAERADRGRASSARQAAAADPGAGGGRSDAPTADSSAQTARGVRVAGRRRSRDRVSRLAALLALAAVVIAIVVA